MIGNTKKIAMITASYSGLGSELCKLLARDGYELVLMNRDSTRTQNQVSQLRKEFPDLITRSVIANLSDHESIREGARQIADNEKQIHRLFHIAGTLQDRLVYSAQENEIHYEVNAVAPFYLTQLLKPQLAAAGDAVVTVVGSSAIRMIRKVNLEELRKPKKFKKFIPYAQSKLIVATAFHKLSEQLAQDNIKIRIVDPGPNKTAMSRSDAMPVLFKMLRIFYSSPAVGARKIYEAAHNRKFKEQTGIYIERGKVTRLPKFARNQQVQIDVLKLLEQTIKLPT